MPAESPERKRFDPLVLLVSFILAVLVWTYVDDRRMETKALQVGLRVVIPEGWEVEGRLPGAVTVRLQGPREQMKTLSPADLDIVKRVSLPRRHESDVYAESIPIHDSDIRTPPGVTVVGKSLEHLPVSLLRLVPEYIRVVPTIAGKPAPGYRVLRVDADPNYVEVMVPKGTVKFGDTLECYPVDISGQTEDVYRRVGVKPTEVLGGRVLHTDRGIDVSVIIDPIPERRTLEKVPVKVLYGPIVGLRVMKIDPPTVAVTVEGSKAVVDNLTERSPTLYVDTAEITGEATGEHTLRCRAILPPGVTVRAIQPEEVRVTIR